MCVCICVYGCVGVCVCLNVYIYIYVYIHGACALYTQIYIHIMHIYQTSVDQGDTQLGTPPCKHIYIVATLAVVPARTAAAAAADRHVLLCCFVCVAETARGRGPPDNIVGDDFVFVMAGPSAEPHDHIVGAGGCFAAAGQSAGPWW